MKKLATPRNITWAAIFLALSLFMGIYPESVRNHIASVYKSGILKAREEHKLENFKRGETADLLSHVEKGELYALQEHDTSDFMHSDYFGEPWRFQFSTFIIWDKARIFFFVFLALLILKPYLDRIADSINIVNLRSKGIHLEDYKS